MKKYCFFITAFLLLNIASLRLQAMDYANVMSAIVLTKDTIDNEYDKYEDSLINSLYPRPILIQSDTSSLLQDNNTNGPARVTKSFVPNSVSINKSLAVGEIPIKSGTSPMGAKTYEIPIEIYPGMNNFTPQLSLSYNSMSGNSVIGVGWSISGLSTISRSGKNKFYDGKTQGIVMDNSDSFILDGMRLVHLSTGNGYYTYESTQGNIKAKAYFTGDVIKYFEVFYPDGRMGVYGFTNNTVNKLNYPITSIKDLFGNTITYNYISNGNTYNILSTNYNGVSVIFKYQNSRQDPIIAYSGGQAVSETKLLQEIECKFGSKSLRTYTLGYTTQNEKSLLTQVGLSSSGNSFNPIRFYYGNGNIASGYTSSKIKLWYGYKADNSNQLKAIRGKFNYFSGTEGVIIFPNRNPYWKHYKHGTAFRHAQNTFNNLYKGDEEILLYSDLSLGYGIPMKGLKTEKGFIDIIGADLYGTQEDNAIKINDVVIDDNNEKVTFAVYRPNGTTGIGKAYTREYTFSTVHKDSGGGKSVQPKFYYTGDFNGDGRMEVMAVSVHQPLGDTKKPSKCYIFDLQNNRILFQDRVVDFSKEFVGEQQQDPIAAENNSDKLFVLDYDGDGKSDFCYINDNGMSVYTFDVSGTTMTAKKVSSIYGLNKKAITNRELLLGDFNGDGLVDILLSPVGKKDKPTDTTWKLYTSKGNGDFVYYTFTGSTNSLNDDNGFLTQDVNGDGMTDLIKYDTNGFYTYIARNNKLTRSDVYTKFPYSKSLLIPIDIYSHSCFTQMLSLRDSVITKYSFSRDDNKESMATGMATSLGLVEKNEYCLINGDGISSGHYEIGHNASFPYVNIEEPLAVLAHSETYMGGTRKNYQDYHYYNAVIHRQGLGFCGFERVQTYDKRGLLLEQTFSPFNNGVINRERSQEFQNDYTWSTSLTSKNCLNFG